MTCGSGVLILNDAAMKLVVAEIPVGQAVFVRGLISLTLLLVLVLGQGGRRGLRWRNTRGQLAAAALQSTAVILFITSLRLLPLSIAVVVVHSSPLFVSILAMRLLAERIGWHRAGAVILGFLGVILVSQPGGSQASWAVFLPLVVAFVAAIRDIVLSRLVQTDTSASILLYSQIAVTSCGFTLALFEWTPMSGGVLLLLVAAGLAHSAGSYLMVEAFRFAEVSLVTPFKYTTVVWAGLLGLLVWGEVPDGWQVLGAVLIVGSGLIVLRRELRTPSG